MTQFLTDSPPPANPSTGRSTTISAKVPPELLKAVLEIVERGQSPYDNVSAFVRAAIHRRVLEFSASTESSLLPPIVVLLKEWSRRNFEFTCYQQVIEGMENNAKMLETYIEHGDVDKAVEMLEDVAQDVLSLVDPFWRKRCLKELFKFKSVKNVVRLAGGRGPRAVAAYEMWKEGQT